MREKDPLWHLNKHSCVFQRLWTLISYFLDTLWVRMCLKSSLHITYWNIDCGVFSLLDGPALSSPCYASWAASPGWARLFDTSKGLFLTSCHAADLPHPTGLTPRGRKKSKKKKLVTWPSAPCPRPPPPCWQQKVCWSEANARNSTRHRHRHRSLGWHDTHASARGKKLRLALRVFADQKGKCD